MQYRMNNRSLVTMKTNKTCKSTTARASRRNWSSEEDALLITRVKKHGKQWAVVAAAIEGRQPKQCRERYLNHLDPSIIKGPFTDEEWNIVLRYHTMLGNRWSMIARQIPGRTSNQVKNQWHTSRRKKNKKPVTEHNVIKPTKIVKRKPKTAARRLNWSEFETKRLLDAIIRYNYVWEKVSLDVYGRTKEECYEQWLSLNAQQEPKSYQNETDDDIITDGVSSKFGQCYMPELAETCTIKLSMLDKDQHNKDKVTKELCGNHGTKKRKFFALVAVCEYKYGQELDCRKRMKSMPNNNDVQMPQLSRPHSYTLEPNDWISAPPQQACTGQLPNCRRNPFHEINSMINRSYHDNERMILPKPH